MANNVFIIVRVLATTSCLLSIVAPSHHSFALKNDGGAMNDVIRRLEKVSSSSSSTLSSSAGPTNDNEGPTTADDSALGMRFFPRPDPDSNRNLTQLITSQGYPMEKYVVQTRDGFMLDLHRIPRGRHSNMESATTRGRYSNMESATIVTGGGFRYQQYRPSSEPRFSPSTDIDGTATSREENLINESLKKYSHIIMNRLRPARMGSENNNNKNTNNSHKSNNDNKKSYEKFADRPVVYLQHGYMSSACDFVMNFANDSLAFILADAGYDVWLGNSRGNTYSKRHSRFEPDDLRFWDWSFDEMAKYDTPAFIDFILSKTGHQSLNYIGHSQGTMVLFALLSQNPEYGNKIRLFVGLAPIISLTYMKSPMKYLAHVNESLLYTLLGRKDVSMDASLSKIIADTVCTDKLTRWVCYNMLFMMNGPDLSNLNQTRLPVYMSHMPAGTSVKNVVHFAQMVREKRFAMYDYGTAAENVRRYGVAIPPAYNASHVTVPALLFTAAQDWLADPKDVSILESTLPNIVGKYEYPTWNHMDFVLGQDAGRVCYNRILQWLQKY